MEDGEMGVSFQKGGECGECGRCGEIEIQRKTNNLRGYLARNSNQNFAHPFEREI